MNKEEFNSLHIDDQVKEINMLVKSEGSLRKACDRLNISRATIRDRFKNKGYSFCKNCNKYVKSSEHKCNTNKIQVEKTKEIASEHNENTNVLLNNHLKKKFMWMMNNFDILETLINERMQNEHTCNTSVIEVKSTEFTIDLPASTTHHTTIRINKAIWDEFNDIYSDKYKHLNKIDVLSMALKQFNDKHK